MYKLLASASVIPLPTFPIQSRAPRVRTVPDPRDRPPADLRIEPSEWQAFAATRANTLMIGDHRAVMRLVTEGWLALERPVVWCDSAALKLPSGAAGTFIIWRVDELAEGDQQRLVAWMDRLEPTRVLARSSGALYPLVQQGAFAASLYYRLNTVLLEP